MEKIAYIKNQNFNKKDHDYFIFLALLKTLTSNDLCNLLDLTFEQNHIKRNAIIDHLRKDIKEEFKDSHEKLISNLINKLKNDSKQYLSGKVLNDLYEVLPLKYQNMILRLLISSRMKSNRNRGCNILAKKWDPGLEKNVVRIWEEYYDDKFTKLLIDHAKINFIKNNFNFLLEIVNSNYKRKLYLRMSEIDISVLDDIKKDDKITYAYMLVQNNMKLTENQAISIYEEYKNDDRITLLYWCFGKMGLWKVLIRINERSKEQSNCV